MISSEELALGHESAFSPGCQLPEQSKLSFSPNLFLEYWLLSGKQPDLSFSNIILCYKYNSLHFLKGFLKRQNLFSILQLFQVPTMWQVLSNTASHLVFEGTGKCQHGAFALLHGTALFLYCPLNNLYDLSRLRMFSFLLMQEQSQPVSLCYPPCDWTCLSTFTGGIRHTENWDFPVWKVYRWKAVEGYIFSFLIRVIMSTKELIFTL